MRFGYEWFNREKETPPTWHADGEFINFREDPDHAAYRALDAIRRQHQGWFDAYPDLRVEPLEIRANGDLVFVWTRFTGHGANSGLAMEMELAHVVTIEDGKTRRIESAARWRGSLSTPTAAVPSPTLASPRRADRWEDAFDDFTANPCSNDEALAGRTWYATRTSKRASETSSRRSQERQRSANSRGRR